MRFAAYLELTRRAELKLRSEGFGGPGRDDGGDRRCGQSRRVGCDRRRLEGLELYAGDQLERHELAHPGDFLYIPAGVPHVVVNRSATPAVFVGARTDPNEQESVILRPDLEAEVL